MISTAQTSEPDDDTCRFLKNVETTLLDMLKNWHPDKYPESIKTILEPLLPHFLEENENEQYQEAVNIVLGKPNLVLKAAVIAMIDILNGTPELQDRFQSEIGKYLTMTKMRLRKALEAKRRKALLFSDIEHSAQRQGMSHVEIERVLVIHRRSWK